MGANKYINKYIGFSRRGCFINDCEEGHLPYGKFLDVLPKGTSEIEFLTTHLKVNNVNLSNAPFIKFYVHEYYTDTGEKKCWEYITKLVNNISQSDNLYSTAFWGFVLPENSGFTAYEDSSGRCFARRLI